MTMKNHLESYQKNVEATVLVQLKNAKTAPKEKKQEAKDALVKSEKLLEARKEETVEAVAKWKAKRFHKRLEKRAERSEEYAEVSVSLALYYAAEAELAILEAINARQDAKAAIKERDLS